MQLNKKIYNMIEVIRHGNYVHLYKCLRCGCLFRANKNDINCIDSDGSDVGYIHCPECKNYIRGDAYFTKTNNQYRTFNKKI